MFVINFTLNQLLCQGLIDLVDGPAAAFALLHHLADRGVAPLQLELVALLRLLVEQPEDLPNVWGFGMLRRWSMLAHIFNLSRKFINDRGLVDRL